MLMNSYLKALVWEGQVRTGDEMMMNLAPWNGLGLTNNLFQTKQRNFGDMKFKLCPTEGFAREHFKKVTI